MHVPVDVRRATLWDRVDLATVLRMDAVANAVGGLAVVAAAPLLVGSSGLGTAWPLRLLGAALAVFGVEQWLVARAEQPSAPAVRAIAAIDLVFAVCVVTLAVADPTESAAGFRWGLAAVGDVAGILGLVKLAALRARHRAVG